MREKSLAITAFLLFSLLSFSIVKATTDTIGSNSNYDFGSGTALCSAVTASASGQLQSVGLFTSGTGNSVSVAIYNDAANKPNQLLGNSSTPTVAAGWNDLTISQTVNIVSGTKYWLCLNGGTIGAIEAYTPSGLQYYDTSPAPYPAWISTWTASTNQADTMNMRMTYQVVTTTTSTSTSTTSTSTSTSTTSTSTSTSTTTTTGTSTPTTTTTVLPSGTIYDNLGNVNTTNSQSGCISGSYANCGNIISKNVTSPNYFMSDFVSNITVSFPHAQVFNGSQQVVIATCGLAANETCDQTTVGDFGYNISTSNVSRIANCFSNNSYDCINFSFSPNVYMNPLYNYFIYQTGFTGAAESFDNETHGYVASPNFNPANQLTDTWNFYQTIYGFSNTSYITTLKAFAQCIGNNNTLADNSSQTCTSPSIDASNCSVIQNVQGWFKTTWYQPDPTTIQYHLHPTWYQYLNTPFLDANQTCASWNINKSYVFNVSGFNYNPTGLDVCSDLQYVAANPFAYELNNNTVNYVNATGIYGSCNYFNTNPNVSLEVVTCGITLECLVKNSDCSNVCINGYQYTGGVQGNNGVCDLSKANSTACEFGFCNGATCGGVQAPFAINTTIPYFNEATSSPIIQYIFASPAGWSIMFLYLVECCILWFTKSETFTLFFMMIFGFLFGLTNLIPQWLGFALGFLSLEVLLLSRGTTDRLSAPFKSRRGKK